jgi:hypothetical protein
MERVYVSEKGGKISGRKIQAWVGVYKYGYQLIKKNLKFSVFYINNLMNSPTTPTP